MTIQPSGPSRPRLEGTAPTRSATGLARVSDETSALQTEARPTGQREVLDLSSAACAREARSKEDGSLSSEQLLQLRQRILDGTYDTPGVLDAVASALRKSRDLC